MTRGALRFVDLSGFGYCGKGVLTDMLAEVEGVHVPNRFFEFNLLRIQGGLLDLKHALTGAFSLIRVDAALRRFERVSSICGTVARVRSPASIGRSNGMSYDRYFHGTFLPRTRRYLDDLTETIVEVAEWPYQTVDESGWSRASERVLRNLHLRRNGVRRTIRIARSGQFLPLTRDYLDDLYGIHAGEGRRDMVLHNSFEPFEPGASIELFHDARCIVMDRDVRDIYVGGMRTEAYGGMTLKRSFLGVDNLESFIQRQLVLHRHVRRQDDDPSRVFRLTFEDAVLDYEQTRRRVLGFLGIDAGRHTAPRTHFDPERSRQNVGLWRRHENQQAIRQLEERLPQFCFQGMDR